MNRYQKLNYALFHHRQVGLAVFAVMLALAAYPVWRVWAAGGNLDTSFSGDGRYTLPLVYPASNLGHATNVDEVLIQTDPNNIQNERVIAAYSNRFSRLINSDYDFLVTRLTQAGTKDSTFGNNGIAKIDFASTGLSTSSGTVTALALQSNNKILVAGNIYNNGSGYIVGLARLTADGDLDTWFSGDGRWFFFGISEVSDMVVQSDGKILLAGRMKDSTGTYWKSALWRVNSNGTPDSSFGTGGYLHTTVWPEPLPGSYPNYGQREGFGSVYVQSDGKIVALNSPVESGPYDFSIYDEGAYYNYGYRLRRFTSSGAPDSTLQVNAAGEDKGKSIRGVGSNIWVVGHSGQYGAIFAHHSANGALDASFGNNGKVVSSQTSVWIDSAPVPFSFPARYVIVGFNTHPDPSWMFGTPCKAVMTQYFSSGTLNTNFGNNGSTETTGFKNIFSSSTLPHSRYSSVRVGLSGKIVVGGQGAILNVPPPKVEFGAVARYWGN